MWAIEILGDSVSPKIEGYRSHKAIVSLHLMNCCSVVSFLNNTFNFIVRKDLLF